MGWRVAEGYPSVRFDSVGLELSVPSSYPLSSKFVPRGFQADGCPPSVRPRLRSQPERMMHGRGPYWEREFIGAEFRRGILILGRLGRWATERWIVAQGNGV